MNDARCNGNSDQHAHSAKFIEESSDRWHFKTDCHSTESQTTYAAERLCLKLICPVFFCLYIPILRDDDKIVVFVVHCSDAVVWLWEGLSVLLHVMFSFLLHLYPSVGRKDIGCITLSNERLPSLWGRDLYEFAIHALVFCLTLRKALCPNVSHQHPINWLRVTDFLSLNQFTLIRL